MKNKLFLLLFIAFAMSTIIAQNPEDLKKYYNNPVISGFNPDPSICKAGNDYYLITSSFEYFPGVPIYHSTDLENWKLIGHVLNRPSQLNLDKANCSGGIYAPCIRYHKGTFYMVTTIVGKGHFICTATNPTGQWSEPHWIANAPGIDPDLFFDDDGKVYMSATKKPEVRIWETHNTCWVQELDIVNWVLIGKQTIYIDANNFRGTLIESGNRAFLNSLEGPHIYKKDGYYFSTFATGGTGHNHAFAIFRSKNIYGPYEMNPSGVILTHRDLPRLHPITATGHADLVQINEKDWAIVYLAKRPIIEEKVKAGNEKFILGRETFLSPVDWSGEWPIVNPKGKIGRGELVHESFNLPKNKIDTSHLYDHFNTEKLHPQWNFVRTPRTEWWSLTQKKGFLNIQLRPEVINNIVNPSYICKRQEHFNFEVTTKMEFLPKADNEEAGILLERDNANYIKYTLTSENKELILKVTFRSTKQTEDSLIAKTTIKSNNIILKMSSKALVYNFSYSTNGKNWTFIKENADFLNTPFIYGGQFTGPMIGMYATSNGQPSTNSAVFDYFNYQRKL